MRGAINLDRPTRIGSPTEELEALRAKVRRCRREAPDASLRDLCRRFGIGSLLLRQLLGDGPVFPRGYQVAARNMGKPIEEVTREKEAGNNWCAKCGRWRPVIEFQHGPTGAHNGRHSPVRCRA